MDAGAVSPAAGRTRLIRIVGLVFYALLGWALWNYLSSVDWSRFRSAPLYLEWLVAAAIFTTIGKAPFALVWQRLLLGMGVQPDLRELLRAYSLSWVGRYTPGKAVMVGARLLYARQLGASEVLEQVLQRSVATGLAIVLIVWAGHSPLPDWLAALLLACVAIGWSATSPSVLSRLLQWGLQRFIRLRTWLRDLRERRGQSDARPPASVDAATGDVFPHRRSLREATLLHVALQIAYGGYTMRPVCSVAPRCIRLCSRSCGGHTCSRSASACWRFSRRRDWARAKPSSWSYCRPC